MIAAMRQIALDFLSRELNGSESPIDLEGWYQDLQQKHPEKLFPFLVEPSERISELFTICPDSINSSVATLSVREIKPDIAPFLPFMKPSGAQSPQVGPIIKRSFSNKKAGPTGKILKTTLISFKEAAASPKPWREFFREIIGVLERPILKLIDQSLISWKERGFSSMLEAAVEKIGEKRQTVFLAVCDENGKLPGERKEYLDYLMTEKLAGDRYVTGAATPHEQAQCALCNLTNTTIFPNALKGAGINFCNMDREGAFPGISTNSSWKAYALCRSCADLLYIYKFHVLNPNPVNKKRRFVTPIAGEKALIVPFFAPSIVEKKYVYRAVEDYIRDSSSDVEETEETLLDEMKEQRGILNLHFLWVDLGQNIEELRGVLTDVPPSRLRFLSSFNSQMNEMTHPIFPDVPLKEMKFSLSLFALKSLFKRPGGKKNQKDNEGKRSFDFRREIASAIFHGQGFPERRFWSELQMTAQKYYGEAVEDEYGLLNEGVGRRGPFLSGAGWIRSMAKWLFYFRKLGVMKMPDVAYQPELTELKPFFGVESGIDTKEKAFSFLVGVLFGKLLQIQGARGVSVGSNALTWLKRLTLKGKDLPELYVKVREKLLAYESEKSKKIRVLIEEIGLLGANLGTSIVLDETNTCYFLLLGQSLVNKVLPKKEDVESKGEEK